MTRINLYKIIFLVCYWVCAVVFYIFFESTMIEYYTLSTSDIGLPFDFARNLSVAVLVTIIGGTALAAFEVLYFNKLLLKQPFGKTLIIRTTVYLFNIFLFTSLAIIIISSIGYDTPLFHSVALNAYLRYLTSQSFILMMIYWSISVVTGLFILQINDKFGQGVLINFLLGKYHHPKEEVRIFMFLDLKSSTAYAEEHGHLKYSRLIQDCFYDLTDVVVKRDASIYQYVGDEVVLTWDLKKGIKDNNCLNTFFDFDKVLKKKRDYYKENYETLPEFKAGLHYGEAIITEIGGAKKEIAYHGDTLNTTSRIQASCNELKNCFLISADLLSILHDKELDEKYIIESKGIAKLKGKKYVVGLFSVEENNQAMASV
jgi:adenylate cyclase